MTTAHSSFEKTDGMMAMADGPPLTAASDMAGAADAGERAHARASGQSVYDRVYQEFVQHVERLKAAEPQWFLERFEEINPLVAPEDEVLGLMEDAPNAEIRAMIVGIMMQRSLISAVTGRRYVTRYQDMGQGEGDEDEDDILLS